MTTKQMIVRHYYALRKQGNTVMTSRHETAELFGVSVAFVIALVTALSR